VANDRADRWGSGVFSRAALGLERAAHQAPAAREGLGCRPSVKEVEGRDWRLPPSPFPMWIFDPRTGLVVVANDAAAHAYGYTRAELCACCVQDLCQPEDPNDGFMATQHARAPFWTGAVRQRRKDGVAFDADIAMIETGDAAHPAVMVIANPMPMATAREGKIPSREGTMRMDAGTQKQPAPTLTSRAKTLLGRATPISVPSGPALGGQRRESPHRPEDSVSHDGPDRHAVTWGATAFVSVDARDLARNVRERVRVQAVAKSSYIFVDCTCGRVWVQPAAFSEALYELLDNAVRVTRGCYPVIIDVRDTAEGDVLWQVQDAGEGMSDRALAELGQSPHATWAEGSARGVAFAWAVIERHGGLLRFESTRGVGTTASIWLPGARERSLAEKTRRGGPR